MAKTRAERRRFWREHVRAWQRSGERREEYCRERGLNPQTFNAWVGRLREECGSTEKGSDDLAGAGTATFVPVEVTAASEPAGEATAGTSDAPIEVEAGGVTLRVAADADTQVLARVITAARRAA